jgi:hypothetical protein
VHFRDGNSNRLSGVQDALKHNSIELEDFLLTKIMIHKKRWYFPQRSHLIHLQQKSTSALEGVFHTIKCKSSKTVTPSMSLLTSVRTQDQQVQNSMNEFQRRSQMDVDSIPLWTNSASAKELTTMAESLKQTLLDESSKYLLRLAHGCTKVELLRRDQQGVFCHECLGHEADFCGNCFKQSPIPVWRRIRTVIINPLEGDFYSLECDCLHNDGYPCRHIACITPILTNHFVPRYHRRFIAFYGRKEKQFENLNKFYKQKLNDRRFIIDQSARNHLIQMVRSEMKVSDERFWQIPRRTCIQRSKKGLIPHQIADLNEVVTPGRNMDDFSQGAALLQEFGFPEESPYSNDSPFVPQSTGHFYQDSVALIGTLCHHGARNKNLMAKLNRIMRSAFSEAFTAIQEEQDDDDNLNEDDNLNSGIIDLFPASDMRKKDKRIKAAGEFDRTSLKKHTVQDLDMCMN